MFEYNVNLLGNATITVVAENKEEAERILKDTMESINLKSLREKDSPRDDVSIIDSEVMIKMSEIGGKDKMAYSTKVPSLKVKTSIDSFNKLVEILNIQAENSDENISKKSIKLKEKLLKYSVPKQTEEENFIDIRFYQNEVLDLFHILFDKVKDTISYETNYYEILLEARSQLNKSNE